MSANRFQEAAKKIPELASCFQTGLKALAGKNSRVVQVRETRELTGSIYLDGCRAIPSSLLYPKRWDYLVGYKTFVFALEIHNLGGSPNEIVKKAEWLKDWITKTENVLGVYPSFFVVSPGGKIDDRSTKILSQRGLVPCGREFDIDIELKRATP